VNVAYMIALVMLGFLRRLSANGWSAAARARRCWPPAAASVAACSWLRSGEAENALDDCGSDTASSAASAWASATSRRVSTLVKWFPDRPGMATGMAIMGFGGGALIASPWRRN
jgi:hypothetical protein